MISMMNSAVADVRVLLEEAGDMACRGLDKSGRTGPSGRRIKECNGYRACAKCEFKVEGERGAVKMD